MEVQVSGDYSEDVEKWRFIPLYKLSRNGGLMMWQVGFDGVDQLEMRHGFVGGVIQRNTTEVKLNSTRRLMREQSLLEARQRYALKYREGYMPAEIVLMTHH